MKTKSTAAIVAAEIRAELKAHGIKAKVTSENYAGGNSVNITVYDQFPATVDKIEEFCSQYKSGHFDSMQDMYVYDYDRKGPTVSYIFVNNDISAELKEKAKAFLNSYYQDPGVGYEYDRRLWEMLSREDSPFWKANKPRIAA